MGGARRATLGLGLIALVAGGWLVSRWLGSDSAPAVGPLVQQASGADPSPPTGSQSPVDRIPAPIAPNQTSEDLGVAPAASAEPRVCPDLEDAIEDLARLLESTDLLVTQVWDPRVELLGSQLDRHCTELVTERSSDSASLASRRLAALSLLRVAPRPPEGWILTPGERQLLWQVFDTRQASPVPATDAHERPSLAPVHREAIARVAGACLAVLGDDGDLRRLLDHLDEANPLAARSLGYCRSPRAARALLERLSDSTRPTQRVGLALIALLDAEDAPQLDPTLARGAAQALAERWRGLEAGSSEEGVCTALLARLDPGLNAQLWGERIDAGAVTQSELGKAAIALARNASSADLARLDGLLGQGSDEERLAAAQALVTFAQMKDTAAELRSKAASVLAGLVRSSPDPLVRRRALYAAAVDPESTSSLACAALAGDTDERVRFAAAVCMRQVAATDALARAALERAAREDPDEQVRRAAQQSLR